MLKLSYPPKFFANAKSQLPIISSMHIGKLTNITMLTIIILTINAIKRFKYYAVETIVPAPIKLWLDKSRGLTAIKLLFI